MLRPTIPATARRRILGEARGRCACDPTRHVDLLTAGVGELEVHHIKPWRIVRNHDPANLIALCPGCHVRADRGVIPEWALQQLKRVCRLRQETKTAQETEMSALIGQYARTRGTILGEGYYTAAAFIDFSRQWAIDLRSQTGFVGSILADARMHSALVVATLYLELDRSSDVLRILALCDAATKRTARYMRTRASAWLRGHRYDLAHRWYARAARAGDTSLSVCCNWGDCMGYLGQQSTNQRARQSWFRRALAIFDDVAEEDAAVLFNKARVLIELGDRQQAVECLRRAAVIGRHYPLPHVHLAFLYAAEGRSAEALGEFDEAVKRRPRRLDFLLDAAECAARCGDRSRGVQYLQMFEQEERYFAEEELQRLADVRGRLGLRPVSQRSRQLTKRCSGRAGKGAGCPASAQSEVTGRPPARR